MKHVLCLLVASVALTEMVATGVGWHYAQYSKNQEMVRAVENARA